MFRRFYSSTPITVIKGDHSALSAKLSKQLDTLISKKQLPLSVKLVENDNDKIIESLKETKTGLKLTPLNYNQSIAINRDLKLNGKQTFFKSKGIPADKFQDLDFTILQDTYQTEFSQQEHELVSGSDKLTELMKVSNRQNFESLHNFIFNYAKTQKPESYKDSKITVVHKANIMKKGDGLLKNTFAEVAAKNYPELADKANAIIVDNCSMQLVCKPQQFEYMVTTSLYGTILNNIGAAMVGSDKLVNAVTFNSDDLALKNITIHEPAVNHNELIKEGEDYIPYILVKNIADILIKSGHEEKGKELAEKVESLLKAGKLTTDIGGSLSSDEFINLL